MIVYCYTNKRNNKKYIGITSRTLEERKSSHIYEAYNKNSLTYNTPFKRAIRKYGLENFKEEVLHNNVSNEQACELEKYYIKKYKTYYKYSNSNGYNATLGGELIIIPKDRVYQIDIDTYEVKAIYGSVNEAESIYDNVYECCNKNLNHAYGFMWYYEKDYIKMTKNEIEHDINIRIGKIVQFAESGTFIKMWRTSAQASEALGLSQGNIIMVCNKQRKTTGKFVFMHYKDYCVNGFQPIKRNMDRSKKVRQLDLNGNFIKEWNSATIASQETGTCLSSISNVCKGKRELANNYKWEYIN